MFWRHGSPRNLAQIRCADPKMLYRPIVQTDPTRPKDAVRLAGGPGWFSYVEPIDVGRRDAPQHVSELPDDLRGRFEASRGSFAGSHLMGVLNVTPDSFSDGGQFSDLELAVARAQEMVAQGADILDIGGESTRPGAQVVPDDEEIARVVPVIKALRAAGMSIPISVDTRKAAVAQAALEAGANMLNDVSALTFDPGMARVAAEVGVPICLMHAQGDPETMQKDPHYADVLCDVYRFLEGRVAAAEASGIERKNILIDPGIGFGKTLEHNMALLRGISLFHGLGCSVLLGVSRKRFIGTIGHEPEASARAPGSVALALDAVRQGVQIIRAHDIREHRQALSLWQALHDP